MHALTPAAARRAAHETKTVDAVKYKKNPGNQNNPAIQMRPVLVDKESPAHEIDQRCGLLKPVYPGLAGASCRFIIPRIRAPQVGCHPRYPNASCHLGANPFTQLLHRDGPAGRLYDVATLVLVAA